MTIRMSVGHAYGHYLVLDAAPEICSSFLGCFKWLLNNVEALRPPEPNHMHWKDMSTHVYNLCMVTAGTNQLPGRFDNDTKRFVLLRYQTLSVVWNHKHTTLSVSATLREPPRLMLPLLLAVWIKRSYDQRM